MADGLRSVGLPCRVRVEADRAAGSRRSASDGRASREDAEAITVATYFRAKGLQWPVVFLPGCNEGLIPHPRAPVEGERRLFYVALTRASQELVASWVAVPWDEARPSRFLAEAGLAG